MVYCFKILSLAETLLTWS